MMTREIRKSFLITGVLLLVSALFTLAVKTVDVQPVGPNQSKVGFAAVNGFLFRLTGVNPVWYDVTEWLGAAAILTACGFGAVGVIQMIRRKSLRRVDPDLFVLGGFYVLVAAVYAIFELLAVNYRPVLMDGVLEVSFPSSHTLIVFCFLSAAMLQFQARIPSRGLRVTLDAVCTVLIVFTAAGRFLSGVHWFSDIVGSLLIGSACVSAYHSVSMVLESRQGRHN